jgi:hypothetical protein
MSFHHWPVWELARARKFRYAKIAVIASGTRIGTIQPGKSGGYCGGRYCAPCAFCRDSIHSWPLTNRVVLADLAAPPAAIASAKAAAVVSSGASNKTTASYSPNG